jgi:hypothetical protein
MSAIRLPSRRHPRAELACPPLPWRAVGRGVARASVVAGVSGAAGLALLRWQTTPERWLLALAVAMACVSAAALLRLAHLVNVARTPVTFKVSNGELAVTRPMGFWRRRRTMPTSSVRGVRVSVTPGTVTGITTRPPTGRLSIRRRHRLPLRIPGRRPLADLHRVAGELRAVLDV